MMIIVQRTSFLFLVMIFVVLAKGALAEVKVFTDSALFESKLDGAVTDDYENPAYTAGDIRDEAALDGFSDAAMSAVFGETKYAVTNPIFYHLVYDNLAIPGTNRFYCTGCNGTFTLDFTGTSVGDANGVYGVGFYVQFSRRAFSPYQPAVATVTFGDGGSADYVLPSQSFFGITADKKIKSIHIGGPGGTDVALNFSFYMDDLTIGGKATALPLSLLVNTTEDLEDVNPGDGFCETVTGSGICSLRAAIMETNAWPGKDSITIGGGFYGVTLNAPTVGCVGYMRIADDLEIIGDNQDRPSLIAPARSGSIFSGSRKVFCVEENATVKVSNMEIHNGEAAFRVLSGSTVYLDNILITHMVHEGLLNHGVMHVQNSSINQNTIGIINEGTMTVTDSSVSLNYNLENSVFSKEGGGIANLKPHFSPPPILVVERSSIFSNQSLSSGGGIVNEGVASIVDSSILNNRSECKGGGVASIYPAEGLTIINSVIDGNRTTDEEVSIDSSLCGIEELSDRNGGGVSALGSLLRIKNSRICNNKSVGHGGGVSNEASDIVIEDSTICGNTAKAGGGGIYAETSAGLSSNTNVSPDKFLISGSTIRENITSDDAFINPDRFPRSFAVHFGGGGLLLRTASPEDPPPSPDYYVYPNQRIINSTFSGNLSILADGGAIRIAPFVDPDFPDPSRKPYPLSIENSTVAINAAIIGVGGGIDGAGELANTIIGNNFGGNCGQGAISLGHNLDSGDTCNMATSLGDLFQTDPLLGPLRRNNSLTGTVSQTKSHALLASSPAIDLGDDAMAPDADQRGFAREGTSDIGAFEFGGSADGDGDGILNTIDLAPAVYSNEFSDQGTFGSSYGAITNRGILGLVDFTVEDAAAPDGVVISAAGVGTGTLSLCNSSLTAFMNAGDTWFVTCGSVGAWVLDGEIEIPLTDTVNLILPQYARVTIDENENGNIVVQNQINSPVGVTLEVDGFAVPLPTGSAIALGGCEGDSNGDGAMTPKDIAAVAGANPSSPGDKRWNPDADINQDGRVDGMDLALARGSFLNPSCLRGPGTAPPN